jgi:hypothetical protein
MKVLRIVLVSVALSAMGVAGLAACGSEAAPAPAAQDQRTHICPMRCVKQGESAPYTQRGPGPCPVCGMPLVPQ